MVRSRVLSTNKAGRQVRVANRLTPELLNLLHEKHGAALTAYACSYGLDFALAEDAVQQVFLKLLQGRFDAVETPAAYLFRAVRNAALNLRRGRSREAQLPSDEMWLTHQSASREEILSVQRALRDLPEEQREAVFLKVWGGLTLQQIAEATGAPLNTVASRYRYALERLREQLTESVKEAL